MRRVYVRLDAPMIAQIVQIAEAERRHPSDQAALMLAQVLAQRGEQSTKVEAAVT